MRTLKLYPANESDLNRLREDYLNFINSVPSEQVIEVDGSRSSEILENVLAELSIELAAKSNDSYLISSSPHYVFSLNNSDVTRIRQGFRGEAYRKRMLEVLDSQISQQVTSDDLEWVTKSNGGLTQREVIRKNLVEVLNEVESLFGIASQSGQVVVVDDYLS